MKHATLEQWNWATLMATQALIGLVSPNFRMVTLHLADDVWKFVITLREEDRQDRIAAHEITEDFFLSLADIRDAIGEDLYMFGEAEIIVTQDEIPFPSQDDCRVLFRMREYPLSDDDAD